MKDRPDKIQEYWIMQTITDISIWESKQRNYGWNGYWGKNCRNLGNLKFVFKVSKHHLYVGFKMKDEGLVSENQSTNFKMGPTEPIIHYVWFTWNSNPTAFSFPQNPLLAGTPCTQQYVRSLRSFDNQNFLKIWKFRNKISIQITLLS